MIRRDFLKTLSVAGLAGSAAGTLATPALAQGSRELRMLTAWPNNSPGFGTSSIYNAGPHGLSELLYAYSSAAANNGSAFGGLSVNTRWYNTTLGLTMLFGRFFMLVPPLAIAGSLARKKQIPPSLGTFPVTTPLFTTLLVGVIVIVGALTFFPALSLGPIVEHFLMTHGQVF